MFGVIVIAILCALGMYFIGYLDGIATEREARKMETSDD